MFPVLYNGFSLVIYFKHSRVYIGEGNDTPLQYSCLENPMDAGAWWAAVQGVAKSQIRLSNMTNIMYIRQCRGDEGEKVRVR